MPARFFCQTGEFAGSSFEITEETMIGRNEDDVRLPSEVVSSTHARIYRDAERGGYFLEDLQSRNGTKLDGMPVTDPVKLGRLHVVTFADQIDFIYQEGATVPAAAKEAPRREVEHTRPADFVPASPPAEEKASGSQTVRTDAFTPAALPSEEKAPAEEKPASPQTIRTDAYTPGALPTEEKPEKPASPQTVRTDAYTPGALPSEEQAPPEEKPASNQTVRTDAFSPTPPPASPSSDEAQHTRIGDAFTPTSNLPGTGGTPGSSAPSEAEPVRFSLEVTKGDRGLVTFPLSEGENIVGRASNCAVSLDDQAVSRQHAVLVVHNGEVALKDLGSRNHTFLDGNQVASEVDVPLGAVIRFGLESEAKLRRA